MKSTLPAAVFILTIASISHAVILQYDDGTPGSVAWNGSYRGTWFDVEDFWPYGDDFELTQVEYWFYQSPNSDPWDTAQFYSEIWNGGQQGPQGLLAFGVLIALHYSPVYHTFSTALDVQQNFWAITNTTLSAGGWPSNLADGAPFSPPHSYVNTGSGFVPYDGDFFIRAHGGVQALNGTTWGALKALF